MREDASKLICERPRVGGNRGGDLTFKNTRHEEMPLQMSMRAARHRRDVRDFSDFLAPLRRYLAKKVGHKWDTVYSEICEVVGKTSTTQLHVFQHVDQYVASNVVAAPLSESVTGWVTHGGFRGEWRHPITAGDLFVDPRDGIIKRAKARTKRAVRKKPQEKVTIVVAPNGKSVTAKIEGIWYLADLVPVFREMTVMTYIDGSTRNIEQTVRRNGAGRLVPVGNDHLLNLSRGYGNLRGGEYFTKELISLYGSAVTAVGMKQMSSGELRQYGVENDAPTRIDTVHLTKNGNRPVVTRVPV